MEFKITQDVKAHSDFVYQEISDFESAEILAVTYGIESRRIDKMTTKGPGMKWDVAAIIRRKARNFTVEILTMDPPKGYSFLLNGALLGAHCQLECIPLNVDVTRMTVALKLAPRNLRGRLLLQSLKLARGRVVKRMEKGLRTYTSTIEEKYKAKKATKATIS